MNIVGYVFLGIIAVGAPARSRAGHIGSAGHRPVLQDPEDVGRVARYCIAPERSYVWIDGRSNVHAIHATTDGLEGYVDMCVLPRGGVDVTAPVAGSLSS
jgi:hypothetical protein